MDYIYQVADHYFALARAARGLDRGSLGGCRAYRLDVLLDSTNRGGHSKATTSAATLGATGTASSTAGGENLIERLVKLASHFEGETSKCGCLCLTNCVWLLYRVRLRPSTSETCD